MPSYLPFVLIGIATAALLAGSLVRQWRGGRAQTAALEQLGFQPCPDQKTWLEETIARIENNREYRYEVKDPKRLPGEPGVYHYIKMRYRFPLEAGVASEEILFPLKRSSLGGLVLTVKPSSLPAGLASRMMGALAAGPWDANPDDLSRLELPSDLVDTNVVAAIGARGSRLHHLIDARTLGVGQELGNAGGIFVQFRDAWCAVSSTTAQIPFRVDEVISRIRPLLKAE
jgi:hypothetical protein